MQYVPLVDLHGPDRNWVYSVKCTVVYNVPYKGSWCTVDLCSAGPVCNHVEQILIPPPPPKPLTHLCPSHSRFSLLAALQRDRPRWSTAREFASSQGYDQWMPWNVRKYCHLFSTQYYCLMKHTSNIYLLSVDCYHWVPWRLVTRPLVLVTIRHARFGPWTLGLKKFGPCDQCTPKWTNCSSTPEKVGPTVFDTIAKNMLYKSTK